MKYSGLIGISTTVEEKPGVHIPKIIEKRCFGNVVRWSKRRDRSEYQNDNITISNDISIVADPFLLENMGNIAYIVWNKSKWKVSNISYEYPRIRISIGELWHE